MTDAAKKFENPYDEPGAYQPTMEDGIGNRGKRPGKVMP